MRDGGSIPPVSTKFQRGLPRRTKDRAGAASVSAMVTFGRRVFPLNNLNRTGFVCGTTKLHAHLVRDAERRVHVESNSPSVRRVGLRLKVSRTGHNVCLGARLPKSICEPLASISSLGGWRNWVAHLLYTERVVGSYPTLPTKHLFAA